MSKAQKTWIRIGVGGALFLVAWIFQIGQYWKLGLFIAAYLIIGYDVLWRAARNIAHGQVFDENFLMCIATIGAFILGEYPEGVAVILFYQVGEQFQSYAVGRSRKSIATLMDIRPDYANMMQDGQMVQVDPEEIQPGEIIYIKAGEKVPLDGIVEEGESFLDTSALTGESVPRSVKPGKEILSGSINQDGLLKVRVTKEFGESTVSKILDLVENAGSKKARAENFITRFAKYYTPIVVIAAVVLAVLPPLVVPGAQWGDWIERALIFLVISCPCALVISIPLGFFGGIGGASKQGILVKGSNYLEALAAMEIAVFDKTGTLTEGTFEVVGNHPVDGDKEKLLEWAALAENYSNHPIAASLRRAYGKEIDTARIQNVEEVSGHGVEARIDGAEILTGNAKLMREKGIDFTEATDTGTIVYVARNQQYQGYLVIADTVKQDAAEAIYALKEEGVRKTVMLTGDARKVAKQIGEKLGIDEIHAELLPGEKVERVEALLKETSPKGKLAFVGDGMNDAPVLSRADIGIAMGGLGSDAAIEAADIVIMDDKPSKIRQAMQISKRTLRIVKQNIVFALGIKGIFLLMGALGIANMWEAVFADVGVSVIAILNAMRALKVKAGK